MVPAIALVGLLLVAAGLAAPRIAWRRASRRLEDRMLRASGGAPEPRPSASPAPPGPPDRASGAADRTPAGAFPPVVARYLARALPDPEVPGHRTLVRVEHEGEFFMGGNRGWRPFRSRQLFTFPTPGFVWDARVRMAPGLRAWVRDAYVAGKGRMEARVGGLIPVLNADDGPELREAALQRYLAEAVWFPGAVGAGGRVRWRALDESRAEAELLDGGTRAVLTFEFDEDGLPTGVSAEGRFREVDGAYEPTPWEGRFRAYASHGGFLVPERAEVSWIVEGEARPYWRARIVSVSREPVA